jgi:Na+/H+ antiporter NhaC
MKVYAFLIMVLTIFACLLFGIGRFLYLAVAIAEMKEAGLSDEQIDQILEVPK